MCEVNLEKFFEEILQSEFFANRTMKQKKEEWRECLIRGMMLMDNSNEAIWNYYRWINGIECNMHKNTLRSAIEYLENAFPEGAQYICVEDISILIYLADAAEYKEIEPERFREWWCTLWE